MLLCIKKTCDNNNNCSVSKINDDLIFDITDAILRKAAILKSQDIKTTKKNRIKKRWGEGGK